MTQEFVVKHHPMFSGQADAVVRAYKTIIGKSGKTWLYVDDVPNAAAYIYVTNNPENTTSRSQSFEGFGGATLKMPLVEGGFFELHGGWRSNPDALFKDTGIDLRQRCLTYGAIGTGRRTGENYETIITGILYYDKEPIEGSFNRIDELAAEMANERNQTLFYSSSSRGGGHSGPMIPGQKLW